jgi:hypothetical protein
MRRSTSTKVGVILPDIHFASPGLNGQVPFDRHDPEALSIVLQVLKDLQPEYLCQLGDLIHLGYLSHWNADRDMKGRVVSLSGEALGMCLKDDHQLINHWFDILQKLLPKKTEMVQLEGNHEEIFRSLTYMTTYDGIDKTQFHPVASWNLQQRGITWVPYQRYDGGPNWATFGKCKIVHGKFVSKNHLELHWRDMGCTNLKYGHTHSFETKDFPHPELSVNVQSIGCLCTRQASYHRGRNTAMGWSQGFSVMYLFPDGKFLDTYVRILNGRAIFNGKTYYAKPIKGIR